MKHRHHLPHASIPVPLQHRRSYMGVRRPGFCPDCGLRLDGRHDDARCTDERIRRSDSQITEDVKP